MNTDFDDFDIDICQCCGREYVSPHHKEKEWLEKNPNFRKFGQIMPQRCPKCFDI